MTGTRPWVAWLGLVVVLLGVMGVVWLTLSTPPAPTPVPTKTFVPITVETVAPSTPTPLGTPTPAEISPSESGAGAPTLDEDDLKARLVALLATRTPLQARLPQVPVPPGGQVFLLTPAAPQDVGWVREPDDRANHWGDFNIYAGTYQGQTYIGGLRFDLSPIPPGAPISYADLTLTGLSEDWLGTQGTWEARMLAWWMDGRWAGLNFHWLSREDATETPPLRPTLSAADLGVGRSNILVLDPALFPRLEARVYQGSVSFRITGPMGEPESLFAWDAGYGSGSLGQMPLLRIVTGPAPATPPPSPTPQLVIVTPEDVVARAARLLTATAQATPYQGPGTPTPTPTDTPLPPNWVTPIILVPTPTPGNAATAQWQAIVATSQAVVYGTPTPLPPNVWTATPTPPPTPTPFLIPYQEFTPTPTPTPTPTAIPAFLRGKILFWSDRSGRPTLMVMNPDGSDVAYLTDTWVYQVAREQQTYSPDGRFHVVVADDERRVPQIYVDALEYGVRKRVTHFTGMSYDPAWSPVDDRIVFVSNEPGNDEIYVIRADGSDPVRLTHNTWEWDKHPSWSPDGRQIVFWSNRETQRKQIWIMDADGSNPRNLSQNQFNDWDPVWVR